MNGRSPLRGSSRTGLRWMLVLGLLLVGGCKTMDGLTGGGEESKTAAETAGETIKPYVEPVVKAGVGLKRRWRESVARSPDEHMQHPGQFVVDGQDLFVGTFQGEVVRLMAASGDTVWERDLDVSVSGGVAVDGERVFVGTRGGEMVALARGDGRELWRVRVSTAVASAPKVSEGRVVFTTLDNRTYALAVEDGKRLWIHSTVPEALVVMGAAPPTIDDWRIYVGYSSGEVYALSLRDGTAIWMQNLTARRGRSELDLLQDVDAAIVVPAEKQDDGEISKIYTVNHQGNAVALHPPSGNRIWEQDFSAIRTPLVYRSQMFIADIDGHLVALSTRDGMELWRVRLSDGLLSAPVLFGERLIIGDDKGRLFAVDPMSGVVTGLDHVDEPILADPQVAQGSLFLWTNEGNLWRFDR